MSGDWPLGMREPGWRVDQRCDICGVYDKHPRHHHVNAQGLLTTRHMDCCHQAGCPDASCTRVLIASGRAHGEQLTAFLHSQMPGGR